MTSKSLATILALLVLSGIASGVLAQTPPTDLRRVDDHWSAWDPPTSFPEGAEVYIIVRGDTLWDLAQRFLGDPYLWPQIWERNRYILDAHWIYPGDPLLLGLTVVEPEEPRPMELTEEEGEPAEVEMAVGEGEEEEGFLAATPSYPFVQLGSADDIYCSGYIGQMEEEFPYGVSGSEYEFLRPSFEYRGVRKPIKARFGSADTIKYGLSIGDIVYLDRGEQAGLLPGQILTAVSPDQVVRHPHTGRPVGRYYSYHGRVQVLAVQEDSAIGEIVQSCYPIVIGSRLKPFEPEPVPSERKTPLRPPTDPASREALATAAAIVHSKDGIVTLAQDHVVFIDQGQEDDLVPGDILTVYRVPAAGAPPIVLGEIALLSVRPDTSVAKVITSRHPIYVGDVALLD